LGPNRLSAELPQRLRCCHPLLCAATSLSLIFLAGCGASGSLASKQNQNPTAGDNTSVTVLATSTANDQLSAFNVQITGLTLTSQSGKTVTLVNAPVNPEFIHLNGIEEPLVTVSVPQDVYTSATLTVSSAFFVCTSYLPSTGLQNSTFEDGAVPAEGVTTILPSAITVSGTSMGVTLDLLVSQSASFSSCRGGGNTSFSITPTFALTAGNSDLEATGLHGLITAVGGGTVTVAGADGPKQYGPTWQVRTDTNTAFQGVSAFTQLTAGMPVDMDVMVQQDGSLVASRIGVYDTNTTQLNVFIGPMNTVAASPSQLSVLSQEQQGYLDKTSYYLGALPGNFGNATYQISGALNNLPSLPFAARFEPGNMVAGQNVSMTSHAASFSSGSLPVATVTLMPQTIDGTVSAISTEGGFTTYTVTLAPYDLFPNLSQQPGQATLLETPNTVVVYADSNTQRRNAALLTVGGLFRFNGLVFNDGGTLRMDCAQINDGVAE
jgi:Domain of unknown function (DUF5666)